jgi:hypothetical protein
MLNNLQAHHLLRSFMKSDLLPQAELSIGERVTVDNAPRFLAAWASALANGDADTVLDELAKAERNDEPVKSSLPAGTVAYDPRRCNGKVKPTHWESWDDVTRKSYLDRQVSKSAFAAAISMEAAARKLNVPLHTMYHLADPKKTGEPTPEAFVRFGRNLKVNSSKLDQIKNLAGAK